MARPTVHFHAPCFDGVVSAVIAWHYLESRSSTWKRPHLEPVGYDERGSWLSRPLRAPSAVVDFLYHPEAQFWADHHATSFLDERARQSYKVRKEQERDTLLYDPEAPSCAALLMQELRPHIDSPHLEELAAWASKTDSATYDSVEEALFGDAPALRVHKSLAMAGGSFCVRLVQLLHSRPLEEVARLNPVQRRAAKVLERNRKAVDHIRGRVSVTAEGVAMLSVDLSDSPYNRYAPFYQEPSARYLVALIKGGRQDKVNVMRNPWLDFPTPHLGRICERHGGGGHQRVGSVLVPEGGDAVTVRDGVLADLQREDRALNSPRVP